MPTFFDYFSGVKVNWKAFLEIDAMKFKEDAWWYSLKQLQFVVEFDNEFNELQKNDEYVLSKIADKIAATGHLKWMLFTNDFSKKQIGNVAKNFKGIPVILKSSNNVLIVDGGEVTFPQQETKLIIVDKYFSSWDDLYPIAKAMNSGTKCNIPVDVPEKSVKDAIPLKSKPANKKIYFSHHDTDKDLRLALHEEPEYLNHFGGVKIDGTYLFARSIDKCTIEGEALKDAGLDIIVDLCREINNYPNLTWLSEIEHAYERSTKIHDNILGKMELMGIKYVIIGSHMRPEVWQDTFNRTEEESIISGMKAFIEKANKQGITVSIQNRMYKHYPSRLLARPEEVSVLVSDFKKQGKDVKYAAHLGLGENPEKLLSIAGNNLNICIVAAEGARLFDYRIPYTKMNSKVQFSVDKNLITVFDADYQSVNELIVDKILFTQD